MKILGISPLDKDATACLFDNGKVVVAIGEERLSRIKTHSGFPYKAIDEIFKSLNITSHDIDAVAYSFADWQDETQLMQVAIDEHHEKELPHDYSILIDKLKNLPAQNNKQYNIPGLEESELYMSKNAAYKFAYKLLSTNKFASKYFTKQQSTKWLKSATNDHKHWSGELKRGLAKYGLEDKLIRIEHHESHAANAFYTSGFEEALIVTLDGYGSGLGGSVSIGRDGSIERLHALQYPTSLGEFYERVTSSLGFTPGRHEGKIVGLAAYETPDILFDVVKCLFEGTGENLRYVQPHNYAISRYLATTYSKPAVAAAYQKVLETVATEYIKPFLDKTGINNVVLSGGVVANVKANQRIFEIDGVEAIFVHPNMGDGGCCVGAAQAAYCQSEMLAPKPINDVYWGPQFSNDEIEAELKKSDVHFTYSENIELDVARLLADGNIVARFFGRMEYGPRSLGNRSILYHAKDPDVNLWLNTRLGRTEFMPFAPATLYEERNNCYHNMNGAEHSATFMTITFDCKERMKQQSPAAVHVDGTARPQLVSENSNPEFHRILTEYHKITGIPSLINTSFNMHEEPIVCSPYDAVRAFKLGRIPYLCIGNFIVSQEPE